MFRNNRRLSFALMFVFLFVLAQLVWWMVFLNGFVTRNTRQRAASWFREQATMQMLYRRLPKKQKGVLLALCRERHPHLDCASANFPIRQAYWRRLRKHQRYVRMFFYEGGVFVVLVLVGLYLLMLGMRAEHELRKQKQNFLSAVSHEMRTPIGTMRLLVESMLMRTLKEEKRRHYLHRLEQQLDRLQGTSDQLLAAAMLQQGTHDARMEVEDLNLLVCEQVETFAQERLEDGVQISCSPASEPSILSVDKLALHLVLRNLLENALKYNKSEEKKVEVRVIGQAKRILIEVEDNGPGISAEEQRKIFDAFYRAGNELTRERSGLGLGLHLVKEMVLSMGGKVSYRSGTSGGGSCFVVSLSRQS